MDIHSQRLLENYRSALDLHSIVAITNRLGKIVFVNEQFCAISQYSAQELLGKDHRILNSGHHSKEFFANMWKCITQGRSWAGDICNKAKDGSLYWLQTTIAPCKNSSGAITHFIAIRTDITEKVALAEKFLKLNNKLKQLTEELKIEKTTLNNKNIALNEIISHIEDEKNRVKSTMATNLETVIYPLLENIRSHCNSTEKKFVELALSSLKELSEPFFKNVHKKTFNLTPKELQICHMIRNGLGIKEIAQMLHLSSRTIGKHRENIRSKLALTSKKINLASYLLNSSHTL